jgi:glycosyltransferase involved in cell wall biosynthesis
VRVAFVSPFVIQGGAERHLQLLLTGLDRSWVAAVYLLALGPLADELRQLSYPVQVVPTSAGLASVARSALHLRKELKRVAPDVVHGDGIKGALVATIATAGTGIPVVWSKCDFSRDGWLGQAVARRCRRIAAVSRAVTESFDEELLERTTVVPLGIPEARVDRAAARAALEQVIGPGGPVVGLLGRFDPHKGHREVIAVLPELRKRVPGVRAAFFGVDDPAHGGYRAALKAEIAAAGLQDAVALSGFRENGIELIAGCAAVAIPSVVSRNGLGREGFSLVALEAMSVGTPVVAYAYGGPPEVLADCGVLVPPGDRDALRDGLARVLVDEQLRTRLAECGRRRAHERFSLSAMIEAMEACYQEATA